MGQLTSGGGGRGADLERTPEKSAMELIPEEGLGVSEDRGLGGKAQYSTQRHLRERESTVCGWPKLDEM